jgi:hypothetical protein
MPILTIRRGLCGGRATVIGTEEWPGGIDFHRWKAVLSGILVYAFLERPAAIISVPGTPTSPFPAFLRGHVKPVRRRPRFPLPFGSYWVGVTESCPETVLWKVADEGEFELGLLWVASIAGDDLARADALVRGEPCGDMLLAMTDEEVIAMDAPSDGRALVWLNPSRPFDEIVDAVREIAERRGWTVGSDEDLGDEPGGAGPAAAGPA